MKKNVFFLMLVITGFTSSGQVYDDFINTHPPAVGQSPSDHQHHEMSTASTNSGQVYDDFIYTHPSTVGKSPSDQLEDDIRSAYKKSALFADHSQTADQIEKLLKTGKIKELKKLISKDQIPMTDMALFWKQTEESKPYFHSLNTIDNTVTVQPALNGLNKTTIIYRYLPTQQDNTREHQLYFVFHWQENKTKSVDIMLVKMPNW